MSDVAPFLAMEILKEANRRLSLGERIMSLCVGEPGAPAPTKVRDAAKDILDHGQIGYTNALGITPLRRRIAQHYQDHYQIDLNPERVVVTTGSSAAFQLAFLAALKPGARIALAEPGYPPYRQIMQILGFEPVPIPVDHVHHYQVTPVDLSKISPRVDALLVASPANPTGSMMSKAALEALTYTCRDQSIQLISDEIYHGLTYQQPAETALKFDPNAIVINSFSKYYCMTGWRLGWMIVPEKFIQLVERLSQNLFISAPSLSQQAACYAFDCDDELIPHVLAYGRNRTKLLEAFPKIGFTDPAPSDGAFYLYAGFPKEWGASSMSLCHDILRDCGVAITPGLDFDPHRGNRTVRISYAGPEVDIVEAIDRLTEWSRKR